MKYCYTIIGLLLSHSAFAIKSQCIQGVDWLPFCGAIEAPGIRCVVAAANTWATSFCAPEVVGCAEVGGCFGDIPPGYWYPFIENGQVYKCRCGCVAADETEFDTSLDTVSGRTIIQNKMNTQLQVASVDDVSTPWLTSKKNINQIMHSSSKEKSYKIVTSAGKSVVVSPGHPVLLADNDGLATLMKKAEDLKTGEMVLTSAGEADVIVEITKLDYHKDLMNFNVRSNKFVEHIVPMNGILLGDSAWQERLNSREARVLLRAEVARELKKGK